MPKESLTITSSGQALKPATVRRKRQKGDGAISLLDVARAAEVSTASASRALARPELVSENLRIRVAETASRLGYVANAAARSLSTRRSGLVGAVLADPADTLAWQMLAAAEQCLSAHELGMLVRVASAASSVAVCAQTLAARGVDALLFAGSGQTPGRETWKPGGVLPFIACGRMPGSDMPSSETIEQRGLALARAYLQQLGHVHVGIVAPRRVDDADERTVSQDATIAAEQVDRLDDADAVRAGVRRLIAGGVTAVVTLSDVAAAAVLRECRAVGIAVPEQLSVIGWGDTALARCLDPQLTSVRLPAGASGQAAAEYLVAALSGRPFTWPDLPLKLVIRESTGPIAGQVAQRST